MPWPVAFAAGLLNEPDLLRLVSLGYPGVQLVVRINSQRILYSASKKRLRRERHGLRSHRQVNEEGPQIFRHGLENVGTHLKNGTGHYI